MRSLCTIESSQTSKITFSSLAAAAAALRQQKQIASIIKPNTEDFKMFAACFHLMNIEFYSSTPDTASLTYIMDRYRDCGALPVATNDPQIITLYKKFRLLATRMYSKFDLKDWVTVVWRLQQARISMDHITMRDLSLHLMDSISFLSTETMLRAIESFASLKMLPPALLFESMLPAFMERNKSQQDIMRMLICLCIFDLCRKNSIWQALIAQMSLGDQPTSYSDMQKMNILRFILTIENPDLLTKRTPDKKTIKSILTPHEKLSLSEQENTPNLMPMSQFSPLHDEVRYVAKLHPALMHFSENYNIGNGFLVDFADESSKTCLDVDSVYHYYRPLLSHTFIELENSLLNGFTVMKYRTLINAGWKVVQVPFFEWEEFEDEKEKQIYLSRKMTSKLILPKNILIS